jgi:hypothetical protein
MKIIGNNSIGSTKNQGFKMNTIIKKKCEEWSKSFTFMICSLFSVTYIFGAFLIYPAGSLALLCFLAIIAANFILAFYTTCRHCYYYGKRCYLGFGVLAPLFYKKKDEPANKYKEGFWMFVFFLTIAYPLFFWFGGHPLTFNSIVIALLYILFPITGVILIGKLCCPKCKNVNCIVNPEKSK